MSKKQIKGFVSVIIPTFNEERNIARLLISLKNQSYKKMETIVVDDGSTDSTVEIANKYATVFKRKHAERSVQRNFGANKARGEYLLFLDADMELTKDVVKQCVDVCKEDKRNGAVIIPEKSVATNFWEKVKAYERSFYNLEGDSYTDSARFFPRYAYEMAGGYDENITGPEDWELPEHIKELGFVIVRVKALIYHYERIKSLYNLAKKKFYYALKSHRYLKKRNISAFSPKTIYFLRPVFYKNWRKLISNPLMSISMIVMLSVEIIAGGIGFILGKLQNA